MATERITCECAHEPGEIAAELRDVLWDGGVTLGELETYWSGGDIARTPEEIDAVAGAIRRIGEMTPHPDGPMRGDMGMITPEFVADVVCAAMAAVPSLTWDDALWRWPVVRLLHVRLAEYRRRGGDTSRPDNMEAAMARLRERNAARADGGGEHV